ncbi:hypothetical protein GOBAR_AA34192 [Gossypium barbadense]|uniref:Uncharacterized protein n=1 Tax=Gossypium barbadense TaxID=3634 RepID=A0A2P5W609_GOSBA|nr:hypothetical protein GOBAR_AA34192 [Gossypium barbadense]
MAFMNYGGASSMAPLLNVPSDWWSGSLAAANPTVNPFLVPNRVPDFGRFGDWAPYALGHLLGIMFGQLGHLLGHIA